MKQKAVMLLRDASLKEFSMLFLFEIKISSFKFLEHTVHSRLVSQFWVSYQITSSGTLWENYRQKDSISKSLEDLMLDARPTGDQEVVGSIPSGSGNILS